MVILGEMSQGIFVLQESTGVVLNRSAPEIVSCARRRLEAIVVMRNVPLLDEFWLNVFGNFTEQRKGSVQVLWDLSMWM